MFTVDNTGIIHRVPSREKPRRRFIYGVIFVVSREQRSKLIVHTIGAGSITVQSVQLHKAPRF